MDLLGLLSVLLAALSAQCGPGSAPEAAAVPSGTVGALVAPDVARTCAVRTSREALRRSAPAPRRSERPAEPVRRTRKQKRSRRPRPATWKGLTVPETLTRLRRERRVSKRRVRDLRAIYARARAASGHPDIAGTVSIADELARRGLLAGRVNPVFANLARTYEYFARGGGPAPAYGARRTFPGSRVIYQYIPGYGWQFHPLANFGRLAAEAGYPGTSLRRLRAFASELGRMAARRNGAVAFEYYFPYSGGSAPWVSAMATGSALQAYARLSEVLRDRRYVRRARKMLCLFDMPAPGGVAVRTGRGRAHYLLYSQADDLRVGNGFAQALLGLLEFSRRADSDAALELFQVGERQLRAELDAYDSGSWSRYSVGGAGSSAHYHGVFTDFLAKLCASLDGEWALPYCAIADRFNAYAGLASTAAPSSQRTPSNLRAERRAHAARKAREARERRAQRRRQARRERRLEHRRQVRRERRAELRGRVQRRRERRLEHRRKARRRAAARRERRMERRAAARRDRRAQQRAQARRERRRAQRQERASGERGSERQSEPRGDQQVEQQPGEARNDKSAAQPSQDAAAGLGGHNPDEHQDLSQKRPSYPRRGAGEGRFARPDPSPAHQPRHDT